MRYQSKLLPIPAEIAGGHLYFYGDRTAMERGDFSKVWVNYEF